SRAGERNGPVQNGEGTPWVNTRSLATLPVPPHEPPAHPFTYEGTALLPLENLDGAAAEPRPPPPPRPPPAPAGWNPTRYPGTTWPGLPPPGRPPRDGDHDSWSHATIAPPASMPARCSIR